MPNTRAAADRAIGAAGRDALSLAHSLSLAANASLHRQPTLLKRTGSAYTPASLPGGVALTPASARALGSADGEGTPLTREQQADMERIVGGSLRNTRLHTGSEAARTAAVLQADAFTVGNDVFFAEGKYDPSSARGQALLAHELTHVRQQTAGEIRGHEGEGAGEAEAEATERMVLTGRLSTRGMSVGRYVRNYGTADGRPLSAADSARLDAISARALAVCREVLVAELGSLANERIDRLPVDVSLDLSAMTDNQAAEEWGHAIAEQVRAELISQTIPPPRAVIARSKNDDLQPVADEETMMKADVDQIVGLLKQQWMSDADERLALSLVERWAAADMEMHRHFPDYVQTKRLDRFLYLLKVRTFSRHTARTGWLAEEWSSAYDLLWHELEDDRLERFKLLVSMSQNQATRGPETAREESAWSYVGKREALGSLGILKAMGLALTGVADASLWLQWKLLGKTIAEAMKSAGMKNVRTGPMSFSKEVSEGFDFMAQGLAGKMGVDLKERATFGMNAYDFGGTYGQIVGALMLSGGLGELGDAGKVIGAVQAAKGVDDLRTTLQTLRKGPPPLTWSQILSRGDILAQMVGVLASVIGVAGVAGGKAAADATARTLKIFGIAANTSQIALYTTAYLQVDSDPRYQGKSPEERDKAKHEMLTQMLSTVATTADDLGGEKFNKWQAKGKIAAGAAAAGAQPEVVPGKPEQTAQASDFTPPASEPGAPAGDQFPAIGPVVGASESPMKGSGTAGEESAGKQPGSSESEAESTPRAGAAAEKLRAVKDWKGEVRKLPAEQQAPLDAARNAVVQEAIKEALKDFPDLDAGNVGSKGAGSDIDVTFQPKAELLAKMHSGDPAAIAKAIKESGIAQRRFMETLRSRTGGEPGTTLDTNGYSFVGSEVDLPTSSAAQAQAATHQADVASLAAVLRGMEEGNPAGSARGWEQYKREQLARLSGDATPEHTVTVDGPSGPETKVIPEGEVGPLQKAIEQEARVKLRRQFEEAEAMVSGISAAEKAMAERLARSSKASPNEEVLMGRAREVLAETRRKDLVRALGETPVDPVKVGRLQAEIKILEPGAYVTPAAVADVVRNQQTQKNAEAMWRVGPDGRRRYAGPGDVVDINGGGKMVLGERVTDLDRLTQSAADSFAQLSAHQREQLVDRIKAAAKYSGRIDHAEWAAGLEHALADAGLPAKEVVERFKTPDGSYDTDRAEAFVGEMMEKAREESIRLRTVAVTRDAPPQTSNATPMEKP